MGQAKNTQFPPQPDYQLVETQSALEAFVRQAGGASAVAVDLEADSMFHYREKVCLLQMAANGETVVIDPLRVNDLSALKPIFADPVVRKVFHGADYDVRSLYRDFGICINNLFDTQLACMYLGRPGTSLEAVVGQRFGVELDKKYQKKDWSRRPLPEEMVAYAAADVVYLLPLAEALMSDLTAVGRLAWVEEGCALLSQVRPPDNHNQPHFLRFRGAGHLPPRQLAVLEALLRIRDALAQQKDRPLFKIMSNAALLKIAQSLPSDLKKLKAIHALSPKQIDMYGQAITAAIDQAMQLTLSELPVYPRQRTPRLSPRIPPRVKALRAWRDEQATRMGLDPALLLNKALIRDIAILRPKCLEQLQKAPNIHQWQIDTFGEKIVEILNNMP